MPTRIFEVDPGASSYALALHGGAGGRLEELTLDAQGLYETGLGEAYAAGARILEAGGSALDAVSEAVRQLEDNPLFNAGRGAALTASGLAELDACVVTGDGRAGAVAVSRSARNPVFLARAVLERSDHVLLVSPSSEQMKAWDLEQVSPEYFITPAREQQLHNVQARRLEASRHGTVGAVAMDRTGNVAAATSTGGMVNQRDGRVGDTPIVGAGTYARDGVVAVSCTGEGESFIEGVVSHDIYARMRYGGTSLAAAVAATIDQELVPRGASGGIIAVGADGRVVVGHNSRAMFAAYHAPDGLVILT